jgi:hypothetical protein
LLYADGTPAHGYLLIALLADPGAHELWKDRELVAELERIADDFHFHGTVPEGSR